MKKTKLKVVEVKPMMLPPPHPDRCQVCASDHDSKEPHNPQSLYYQVAFKMKHGREVTWMDAFAHCEPKTKKLWEEALAEMGVDYKAGYITPRVTTSGSL